jgi:hypothetical protein
VTQNISKWTTSLAAIAAAVSLTSCVNIWGVVDSPSGDEQNLSAARACFDEGNLKCAREYYEKLSQDYGDVKQSELAFALLDENHAGMTDFIAAFGNGGGADGVTRLANSMSKLGAGPVSRGNLQSALLMSKTISSTKLSSLVVFVSAASMIAEVLGETAGSSGNLLQTQIANTPGSCGSETNPVGCLVDAGNNCTSGTGGLADGTGAFTSLLTQTVATIQGNALTLDILFAAAADASTALSNLGASGKFKAGLKNFTDAITAIQTLGGLGAVPNSNRCLRQVLMSTKVGK